MNILTDSNYITYYPSPLGLLKIKFNIYGLVGIDFEEKLKEIKSNCKANFYQDKRLLRNYNLIFDQLNEYFTGKRHIFDLPLILDGSEFEMKVWSYLMKIPYGKTAAYSEVASSIGHPKAARAVGNANKKNPIAIVIPCHRVIGADGSLHGYASGVWRKKWLLKHELKNSIKLERKNCLV
ncbi:MULTISPECIES: methylated-DNA--[protein]-cysteine S-methyltransferase [unclassified Halanaerobium]|uniref:methylated-DNA--[protein]-cysteine S-methyltransferase n=1 Tax=unclassified Halanaerobium TaxID=2641197 RepID=UPI001F291FDF|nr:MULTISPECIES: methylated-DNA--[protein]-cysteine S-methyltransferase [unclassified Halanaerobium]